MKLLWQVVVVALVSSAGGCGLPREGLLAYADGDAQSPPDATSEGGVGSSDSGASDDPAVTADSSDSSDANRDGVTIDNVANPAPDANAGDASPDASTVCASPIAVPCIDPLTRGHDFCSNGGACGPCTDVRDDAKCATAYGTSSQPYLCLSGLCTQGDCRTHADCNASARGPLCGAGNPYLCGPCTADVQCAGALAATPTCDRRTGQCVTGTCTPNGQNPPALCPANPADICCAGRCQAGGTGACCPGAGANAYCGRLLGQTNATCSGGVCTTCPPAPTGMYAVDPLNGSDQTGTGTSTPPGCAFKTMTAVLQLIGNPAIPTTITIIGPSTVGAGEVFPIAVPANVRITTSGGAVTVSVQAAQPGFTLNAANSVIAGGAGAPLAITGQTGVTPNAIVVGTGSQLTTRVTEVTVSGFAGSGILVNGSGALSIGPGVTSTRNGTTAARFSGIHVTATGHADISVGAGATPTHFDGNTAYGIVVDGNGWVTINGVVTSAVAGTGTVTANGNYSAGISISEMSSRPQNVITGLVSSGATNGDGMVVFAGVKLKLRNSVSLGNFGSGVRVVGTAVSSDITEIDLGNAAIPDYGRNVFQGQVGAAPNGAAGVCLEAVGGTGTVLAAGNVFGATNCELTAGLLATNAGACDNTTCTGGVCDLGIADPNNDIDVSMCTHP